MKTKQHLLHTHTLLRTHTCAHTAPPTGKAPPSRVCIAPKRAASFPSPFFIIQAKETRQHPATSYSHPLLSSLHFHFLWHKRIAYYRGGRYVCYNDYTPRTRCFLFLLSQALGDAVLSYTEKPHHHCMFTAALCTFHTDCYYFYVSEWTGGE